MPPFIVAMLAIVVLVTFFPGIALWLPRTAGLINP
jgi:TRAP-type C4-dicarboxylate transport system permease large subunit